MSCRILTIRGGVDRDAMCGGGGEEVIVEGLNIYSRTHSSSYHIRVRSLRAAYIFETFSPWHVKDAFPASKRLVPDPVSHAKQKTVIAKPAPPIPMPRILGLLE